MDLKEYFESAHGLGLLATSDSNGDVDIAVYSRPHIIDADTLAFIMADRRSHRNLQTNPKAAYLFIEEGGGYTGKRIYLKKTGEDKNSPFISELRRKKRADSADDDGKDRFLVYFEITSIRPLTGDAEKQ
ncbi:MAG: pyridoxamine 5'-phosphate oxidase family protein [Spirochaetes bacterium]|nr:pyridoxamine 5'-phosphate oxidase family protein [Spirochaetota bacterium]